MTTLYDFTVDSLQGQPVNLSDYRGKIVLIVNVASKCAFTPQYRSLEGFFNHYEDKGVVVLGFPCNQFGGQEPGSAEEIAEFCSLKYEVTFPMFAKIDVKGDNAHPLYQWLTKEKPGIFGSEAIKWNFTKFLIKRDGSIYQRYSPTTTPQEINKDVNALLAQDKAAAQ